MLRTRTFCVALASYPHFRKAGETTFVRAFGVRMIESEKNLDYSRPTQHYFLSHPHDRIHMISSRSSRAISLRLPARTLRGEKEQFDRISRLKKRLRRCSTRLMSRQ